MKGAKIYLHKNSYFNKIFLKVVINITSLVVENRSTRILNMRGLIASAEPKWQRNTGTKEK